MEKLDLGINYGPAPDTISFKSNLEDAIGAILKQKIVDGIFLRSYLTVGGVEIPHSLGREYNGYIVVKRETWDASKEVLKPEIPYTGDIFEAKSEDPTKFIKLFSPGMTVGSVDYNVAVNVWVF